MPRKKKGSNSKTIGAVLLIVILAVGIIAIHDGLIGVTPIENLLEGDLVDGWDINDGTAVTVKGNISSIVGDWVIIYDDTGAIGFDWNDADSLEVGMTIVVRGETDTTLLIIRTIDASSVTPVWLFA
jgi:hypothetical protein